MIERVTFIGQSGREYAFSAYSVATNFNPIGGLYIFTHRYFGQDGKIYHRPLYIGQTDNFMERIPSHEKWFCVASNGCNSICALVENNESLRLAIETDLRHGCNTPCNQQGNGFGLMSRAS